MFVSKILIYSDLVLKILKYKIGFLKFKHFKS